MKKITGNYILQGRSSKGISQNRLGELIGVSGTTISKWETNRHQPRKKYRHAIMSILGGYMDIIKTNGIINKKERKNNNLYSHILCGILGALLMFILTKYL